MAKPTTANNKGNNNETKKSGDVKSAQQQKGARQTKRKTSLGMTVIRVSFLLVVSLVALNHFYPVIPRKMLFDTVFYATKLKVEWANEMQIVNGKRVTPEGISSGAKALEMLFSQGGSLKVSDYREMRAQFHNEFGPLIRSYLPHLYSKKTISKDPLLIMEHHPSPKSPTPEFYILYLHGGGYVSGSAYLYRTFAAELAKRGGADVFALDYHLAPEYPLPNAVKEAVSAYAYMINELKIDHRKIVIAGDSAGGGLTALTLLQLRNSGKPLPAGAVMISPWTDLSTSFPSWTSGSELDLIIRDPPMDIAAWATNTSIDDTVARKNPIFSPYYADLRGLPPLFILVGSIEKLRDDSVYFAHKAKESEVEVILQEWKRMQHVWPILFPYFPEASDALDGVISFSKRVTTNYWRQLF
eukprot:TRINITY_DN3190_c0_g1_i1.p1 TRINITY_DN3190_c0_g1~~TRINITY_DN3190_c0_g1_i1.p1  ORF type:complete len:413 (-),score=116.13 TRINITY_DN3190_c0_g1_i1:73-1311(-)